MEALREMFRYHTWATRVLIDNCAGHPASTLDEIVAGTDRSILQTLTHVLRGGHRYLELLTGEPAADPIRQDEVLPLASLRRHLETQAERWEAVLDRFAELDVTLPADEEGPAIPQAQYLLVLQAIQHGIDHRSQICTTLSVLGLEPPIMDGWAYWAAMHPPGV